MEVDGYESTGLGIDLCLLGDYEAMDSSTQGMNTMLLISVNFLLIASHSSFDSCL